MKRAMMIATVFLGGCLTSCGPSEWNVSDVVYEGRPGLQISLGGFEAYIGLPGKMVARGEASGETDATVRESLIVEPTPEPEGG